MRTENSVQVTIDYHQGIVQTQQIPCPPQTYSNPGFSRVYLRGNLIVDPDLKPTIDPPMSKQGQIMGENPGKSQMDNLRPEHNPKFPHGGAILLDYGVWLQRTRIARNVRNANRRLLTGREIAGARTRCSLDCKNKKKG